MKLKSALFASLLFSLTNYSYSQCPTTGITISTQAQLNSFPTTYAGCTIIPDGIDIKIMGTDITDLSPLSQLTEIYGAFELRDCPLLTNLTGLDNIAIVGNDPLDGFILRDLPSLTNVNALNNLHSITGEFTIRTCNVLNTLTGLNSIDSVMGSVIIRDNAILQNLNGLNALVYIGETLELVQNYQLTDISALSNVNTIIGGIEGGVFIEANTILSNLNGLGNNTTVIGSNLDLLINGNLSVCAVPSICNYLANPPIGAVITINLNLTGCNTEVEITNQCIFNTVIENDKFKTDYTIFPNPTNTHFKINVEHTNVIQIEITDMYGKTIEKFYNSGNLVKDISTYPSGIYFIRLIEIDGSSAKLKIIKV